MVSLHASVVNALYNGEFDQAQGLLDKAFGKGVLLAPPGNPDTLVRSGLSQTDADRLRLLQSEILYEKGNNPDALKLLESIPDPHDPESHLRWLIDQASVLNRTGKLKQAQALLQKYDAESGSATSTELVLKANLLRGSLLLKAGQYEKAGASFRETAAAAQGHGLPFYRGAALMNLSVNSVKQLRYDESVDYSKQVLEMGNRRLAAPAQNNLDLAYYSLGNLVEAEKYGTQAIELSRKSGDTRTLADALGNLANVYIEQGKSEKGKFDAAVKALEEARELSMKIGAKGDASRWAANLALAHLNAASAYSNSKDPDTAGRADSEWSAAEKANQEAYELLKQLENPEQKLLLELNDAEIAVGRNQFQEAEQLYRKLIGDKPGGSLEWVARARLGRLFATQNKYAEAKHEYELALKAVENERSSISSAESRIAFRNHLIRFFWNYVDLLVSEHRYDEALEVVEYCRAREMAEKLGKKIQSIHQVRAAAFQAYARRTGDVLLSYWLAPERSFVWAVDANGVHWSVLPERKVITDAIAVYRQMIETDLRDPIAESLPQGDLLSAMLLGPVKQYLGNGKRVIVVPDSDLHMLNMETLPVVSTAGSRYWIESAEIAVSPSLILLSEPASATKASTASNLLLVGAPVSSRVEYPELQGAKVEMAGIQKVFAGRDTVVEGAKATPRQFLAAMPANYSMIHFAAHAVASFESPLDSAVILSEDSQGFKLYAKEITNMNLSANLVTLSACHSAGARLYNGEGMVGFAWAFMQSGVRNVIAGLWDVDDAYSAPMMISMYQELASGKRPSTALHDAKLALIHSANGSRLKPVYWAPFQTYLR